MKNITYILLLIVTVSFLACENDELDELRNKNVEDGVVLPELTAGTANFSTYVSLGNSLTSGFTDSALFKAAQLNSFPNILSQKFALVGGGTFTQPLMNDNIGGIAIGGTQLPGASVGPRLVTLGGAPIPLTSVNPNAVSTTDLLVNNPTGPFNNMGVTGASSFHLITPGYGNINNLPLRANPYFVRMTGTTPDATIMEIVKAQSPTFVTLWIGANDVLGYALGGASSGAPTPQATFDFAISEIMADLAGAQGIMANIPNITDLPYFTTVPNNALVLSEEQAASLTGVFSAVSGIFLQGAVQNGATLQQAQALAAQYQITFNEGPNRFLIDVPVTPTNPLGFRQMTEEELLVLTIDQNALSQQGYGSVALSNEVLQVLALLQTGGTPTPQQANLVLSAVNGIDDGDALDSDELTEISMAIEGYNTTIQASATAAGFGFVDANFIFQQMANGGYTDGDFTLTTNLVTGGAVSLDGFHPTSRGYALVANEMMKAIDATYGSNFEASGNLVNLGDYPTNYSPLLQ